MGGDDVDVDGGHEEAHGGAGEPRGAALHDVARLQPPRCSGKDEDAVHPAHPALAKNSKGVVYNREGVVRPALGQPAREPWRVPQMDEEPDTALYRLHGVLLDLCGAVEISTAHGRKVSVSGPRIQDAAALNNTGSAHGNALSRTCIYTEVDTWDVAAHFAISLNVLFVHHPCVAGGCASAPCSSSHQTQPPSCSLVCRLQLVAACEAGKWKMDDFAESGCHFFP